MLSLSTFTPMGLSCRHSSYVISVSYIEGSLRGCGQKVFSGLDCGGRCGGTNNPKVWQVLYASYKFTNLNRFWTLGVAI